MDITNRKRKLLIIFRRIKFSIEEIAAYIAYFFLPKCKNQKHVIIFAQGRTGSTLLESLLSSADVFSKKGELLKTKEREVYSPIHFILGLSKLYRKNFSFHVKIYHLTANRKRPIEPSQFLQTLHNYGWKIIHLKRKNKIKHCLSSLIAEKRGSYIKVDDKKENIKLSVDYKDFIIRIKNRYSYDKDEEKALDGIVYHEIEYEKDLENPSCHQDTMNKVFDYLQLERTAVQTNHKKVNTLPMKELILNYAEFIKYIKQHKLQQFIDN